MWKKYGYKGVTLFAVALLAILWIAGSDKSTDSSSSSGASDNTPEMRQALVKKLNEDSQLRDRLMTKQYVNLVSLDDAKFAAAEIAPPTFVMYSDMSTVHGFKDNDPDTTSLFCIWVTGMIDQSTLQNFGFKQIVFGDSDHHVTCQVIAQPGR